MHFLTIVALPPGYPTDPDSIEAGVARLMAPYNEEENCTTWVPPGEIDGDEGYWTNEQSFWDWYQIGGRWSGELLPGYDPQADPANWQQCIYCADTPGIRDWPEGPQPCNGCAGWLEVTGQPGVSVKWPTQWVTPPGTDWALMAEARDHLLADPPYYLVSGERHYAKERRNPDWDGNFGPESNGYLVASDEVADALTKIPDDAIVVVVDCHC